MDFLKGISASIAMAIGYSIVGTVIGVALLYAVANSQPHYIGKVGTYKIYIAGSK